MKVLTLVIILLFFKIADSFFFQDCTYDATTSHVEYICESEKGTNFMRRTSETLYCNNDLSGIERGNIQIVSFMNCRAERLTDGYFASFTNLRVLNISSVDFGTFNANNLKYNKYLEEIIASNNHLSTIPADLFSHTSELHSLDFSKNQIQRLDPFVFDSARKLKTIQFSSNSIEELNRRLFSNLPELEYLDLSNNKIKHIESDLLHYNKKLKSLSLINNQVERLSCDFLNTLVESRSLEISLNTLKSFETGCSNDNTDTVYDFVISPNESTTGLKLLS